ncbi:transient receptor potential cation channel subfamily A member 1-like [Lasioglossum baleicum]|uniref:transient receptor potential cation channel subfamily A member 1-like n=1 Tax=Lasioglossum baleicum TaxID=434251 RepID=UPI003FCD3CDA
MCAKILITSVVNGNLEIVEDLLKNGADVNMLDYKVYFGGISLLQRAVNEKQVQMAKLLINYGANVNVKNIRGETPIVNAIQNRDTKMIELLLTNGADIKEDPEVVCTAVMCGNLELVEDLLKNGTDVNMLNGNIYYRNSLLHRAVNEKQVQMAKLLINYGANVNVKDTREETPIVNAIQNRDTKMIELLLTNGADIKEDPKVVCTAVRCRNLELVEDLLKNGADINALDNMYFGNSFLHMAVKTKQVQMVKLLINYGANVNVKDSQGETPIVNAIQNRDKKMIELLLTNGVDIKEDPKVLRAAVENGNLKIVEDILMEGADVNMLLIANSSIGRFLPLHKAVMQRQLEMANVLIKYGANVNAKDSDGATPIFYAINKMDTEMIELLLINGADIKFHPNIQRVKCSATKLLKQHMAKMKAAGLYVSERNLWWISRDYKISNFLNKCDAEVQIMKRKKIDNSCASFYDILIKNTSELAKNESIVKALKSDDYKTMFPIYASTIDSRFRRGVEREELLEQVRNKFLPSLFKSLNELPFLCTEKIFSYLSDKDLRILLVACKLFNK